MKRDWDTVRRILTRLEEMPSGELRPDDFADDEDVTNYHMNLLIEARLVEGACQVSRTNINRCKLTRLTWNGHELLDSIRRDSIWNRIKTKAQEKGIDMTFDVIAALAKQVMGEVI